MLKLGGIVWNVLRLGLLQFIFTTTSDLDVTTVIMATVHFQGAFVAHGIIL